MRSPAEISMLAICAVAFLGGCGAAPITVAPPTITPATAAIAPTPAVPPTGVVRQLSAPARAALIEAGALVVLAGAPDRADRLDVLEHGAVTARSVKLPAPATALAADGTGRVVLATRGGYLRVTLADGSAQQVAVNGAAEVEFTAIARRADGRFVLGTADGAVLLLDPDGTGVTHREHIFARVDSIVVQGNTAVVLDRGQTSVTSVGADGQAAQALRAGEGATTMSADAAGRVLVADTRGDELLVFGVDPLLMRQRYPVPDSPYGLGGSRALAWVSQTATNTVIGYDLATGIPVEKVRYPTVQQPDTLAYDDASGTLYVLSGSDASVQVIEHAGEPR
jgi:DNA-binding beta-propeller fold protein YncE